MVRAALLAAVIAMAAVSSASAASGDAAAGAAPTADPALCAESTAGTPADPEANKKLVLDMWHGVIEEHSDAAVMRYIAPCYRQHNILLENGRDSLRAAVARLRNPAPGDAPHPYKSLIHAVAQGDLVALIWVREEPDPAHPGQTIKANKFDLFRVEHGMVVEHWDDAAQAR
jgi:predicted SnoaL-like aldol condensation-catalyzing enzyme